MRNKKVEEISEERNENIQNNTKSLMKGIKEFINVKKFNLCFLSINQGSSKISLQSSIMKRFKTWRMARSK